MKKWYRKSEKIKLMLGNALETAYLQNGFGYFYHQCGEYINAEKSLYNAFFNARQARDFHEVGMVLCNMGINYLYAFCWQEAARFFQQTLNLLKVLSIPGLSYHSEFEIKSLHALALHQTGHAYKATDLCRQLDESDAHERAGAKRLQSKLEEEILFLVLKALVLTPEHTAGQPQEEVLLDQAERLVDKHEKVIGYRRSFVSAARHGLSESAHFIPLYSESIDFESVLENARAEVALHRSNKALEEIRFLRNLQLLIDEKSHDDVIPSALGLLRRSFPHDWVMLTLIKSEGAEYYAAPDQEQLNDGILSVLYAVLEELPQQDQLLLKPTRACNSWPAWTCSPGCIIACH